MTYRIFDSMDQPIGHPASTSWELYDHLETLQREAEEDGSTVTFAIGKVLPDGNVTFDI